MRRIVWISALVLIAGIGAMMGTRIVDRHVPGAVRDARPDRSLLAAEREALAVARRFVLWAVPLRRNRSSLAKAWQIVTDDLKKQCACTRERWLSGRTFVMPYPIRDGAKVNFTVSESSRDRVVLVTRLVPERVPESDGMVFFLSLKSVRSGPGKQWLVDYWAPSTAMPPPQGGRD